MEKIIIASTETLVPLHKAEHEPYEFTKYVVTPRQDFDDCYVAFMEIPPLKANYPMHYHMTSTEVFYIISGCGMLETPEGGREIRTGDVIVFPHSQPEAAHRLINTSATEPLKYIDFDTVKPADIIHYPKSEKTGIIIHNQERAFYKDGTDVEYYDGE